MLAPVLLIDDDHDLASAYRFFLEAEAIPVVFAQSQEEALALLAKSPQYSLLLVDFRMPGMPGEAFYQRLHDCLQSAASRVPIAVFSNHTECSPVADKIRSLGGLYIEKPHDIDRFVDQIKKIVGVNPPPP